MKKSQEAKHILLLSMSYAALKLIDQACKGVPALQEKISNALIINDNLIKTYPIHDQESKVRRWIKAKFREWRDNGQSETMGAWHPLVLATMASNVLEDLLDSGIDYPDVREKVKSLKNHAVALSYGFADVVADEYMHFAEASSMVNQMYEIIHWR